MEMVAWLAGEPHSDEPQCSCPVLAAFVRACNDAMSDDARNRHLRPIVPFLVNTRGSAELERRRGDIVLDCMLRELVPAWLRRRGSMAEARVFEQLPRPVSTAALQAAARALGHYGDRLHAARWVVQRALERQPPARYVAGAVQIARALGNEDAWCTVTGAAVAMSRLQRGPERELTGRSI